VLVGVQTQNGDLAGAKASLERLRDLAGTDPTLLAAVHLALADVEDRLGNRNQAAWERARAREIQQGP
jgi:ATP/maltotriose-dependent transcriptional regulator MalT